jgi:hypothetical protein
MVTPSSRLDGDRPVDILHDKTHLIEALEAAAG